MFRKLVERPTLTRSDELSRYDPEFTFFGGVANGFNSKAPECLMSGAAGTGKTLANLTLLYWVCRKYAGARILIVRKTRESLTETVLVTWERDVLKPDHPILTQRPIIRRVRQSYQFPNGSTVVLGGMDKPDKVLSSEWDIIYAPEATELTLTDWETLSGRLRSGRVPYQRIIADCNPTTPHHWLYQRCKAGLCELIATTHKDNPRYWDRERGEWTPNGKAYLDRLGRLTGHRRTRFLEGKWVAPEGIVYPDWEPATHLIDRHPIPPEWPRYLAIDFGFTNPFVCLFVAEDPDGRLIIYREIYRTKTLVEDHARAIRGFLAEDAGDATLEYLRRVEERKAAGKFRTEDEYQAERDGAVKLGERATRPRAIICDHDAEDRATLERHLGLPTTAADKAVSRGIQMMTARMAIQPDGKPRLLYMRDSLVQRDPELDEAKRPCSFVEEMDTYVWQQDAAGRVVREQPVKESDHACDAARYTCVHIDTPRPQFRVR